MTTKRKIEVFGAGCPLCMDVVEQIRNEACSSCEVSVLDMKDTDVAARARKLGINSVPAVVIDGKLMTCCTDQGIDLGKVKESGLGVPIDD